MTETTPDMAALYAPLADPASLFRLDGQVALVTGAAAGLGFQIARGLAGAGARVALHGRDRARTEAAAALLPGAEPVVFDITDAEAMAAEVEALAARHGRLDIVVCNAGIRDRRSLMDTSSAILREVLEVNLVANFELARLVAPHMIARGYGRIVLMSSNGALKGGPRGSTYAASKAALSSLTRSLSAELGGHGITVNAISPGYFATEFNLALLREPATLATIKARVPLKRPASPEEMIGPALFLASKASSYVTGHVLHVDGGQIIAQ